MTAYKSSTLCWASLTSGRTQRIPFITVPTLPLNAVLLDWQWSLSNANDTTTHPYVEYIPPDPGLNDIFAIR